MKLFPITLSEGKKSIDHNDLCATCWNCAYQPGEMSACSKDWPGLEDSNDCVQECDKYEELGEKA